jgi:hypothetical protein
MGQKIYRKPVKLDATGTTGNTVSAILEINSTDKGVLQPRMTTAQKLAIVSPATGLEVFDTDLNTPQYYNGTAWVSFGNITGSGTTNYLPKFTSGSVLGNSLLQDDGTGVFISSRTSGLTFDLGNSTANIATRPFPFNTLTNFSGVTSGVSGAMILTSDISNLGEGLWIYKKKVVGAGAGWYKLIDNQLPSFSSLTLTTPKITIPAVNFPTGWNTTNVTNNLTTPGYTGQFTPVTLVNYTNAAVMFKGGTSVMFRQYDGLSWSYTASSGNYIKFWDETDLGGGSGNGDSQKGYVSGSRYRVKLFSYSNASPYQSLEAIILVDGSGNVTSIHMVKPPTDTARLNLTVSANKALIYQSGSTCRYFVEKIAEGYSQFYPEYETKESYSGDGQTKYFTGTSGLGIGHTSQNTSAILQLDSTTKGVLQPRMTTTQKLAIGGGTPPTGLEVFDTTLNAPQYYNGTSWVTPGDETAIEVWSTDANYTSTNTTAKTLVIYHTAGLTAPRTVILPNLPAGSVLIIMGNSSVTATNTISLSGFVNGLSSYANAISLAYGSVTIYSLGGSTYTTNKAQFTETTTALSTTKILRGNILGTGAQDGYPTLPLAGDMMNVRLNNTAFGLAINLRGGSNPGFINQYDPSTGWWMTPNTGDNPTLKFWDGQEITSGITPIGTYGASYSGYYFYEIYDVVGRSIRGYFHRNSSGVPSGLVQIQQETSGLSIAIGGSPVKVTLTNTNAAWVNIRLKSTITEISKMPELYGKYSNDGQTQFWTGIGGLGVGHTSQNASAIIQVDSTTKGVLQPRMTTTQKLAIAGVTGLEVFDTDLNTPQYYNGTSWVTPGDEIAYETWSTDAPYTTINTTAKRLVILQTGVLTAPRLLRLSNTAAAIIGQEVIVVVMGTITAVNCINVAGMNKINTTFNIISITSPFSQTLLTYKGSSDWVTGQQYGINGVSIATGITERRAITIATDAQNRFVGVVDGVSGWSNESSGGTFYLQNYDGTDVGNGAYAKGTNNTYYGGQHFFAIGNASSYVEGYYYNAGTISSLVITKPSSSANLTVSLVGGKIQVVSVGVTVVRQHLLQTWTSGAELPSINQKYSTNGLTSYWTGTGGLGVGHTSQNASAILQVDSTSKGFLPPRMTTALKNLISQVEGLIVYDTDLDTLCQSNGTTWTALSATVQSFTSVGTNYAILTSDQIVCANTSGITITLPTAVGITGRVFTITNGSTGNITVDTTSSQTISGNLILTLTPNDSMDVYSNGSNYFIK